MEPRITSTPYAVSVYGPEGTAAATYCTALGSLKGPGWYINRILIHESKRTQGHGARYLRLLVETAQRQQALPMLVEPGGYNTPIKWLRRWYKKQGFKPVRGTGGAVFIKR